MELSGYVYACSGGETFDSVAREVYGDEIYAADLMCANPEYCSKARFDGGERLYLPVVTVPEDEEAGMTTAPQEAPWRE